MRSKASLIAAVWVAAGLLVVVTARGGQTASESTQTAAELIEQAHKYDGMYSPYQDISRQKAIALYSQALQARPHRK